MNKLAALSLLAAAYIKFTEKVRRIITPGLFSLLALLIEALLWKNIVLLLKITITNLAKCESNLVIKKDHQHRIASPTGI